MSRNALDAAAGKATVNRIHVAGWVVKEYRTAWQLTIGFVNGKAQVPGYTGWISKSQCEVEHRAKDFVHLWIPVWFHVKNRKPQQENRK